MIFTILQNIETKEIETNIFYTYKDFFTYTFKPAYLPLFTTDFSISGKNYNERKENAKNLAIDLQHNLCNVSISYGELATIGYEMEKIAKKYGLVKEFKENAII